MGLNASGATVREPGHDLTNEGFTTFGPDVPNWAKSGLKCKSEGAGIPELHLVCGWGICSNPSCANTPTEFDVSPSWRTVRKQ